MSNMNEGHTFLRYDGELNNLHLRVLEMGGLALNQLELALRALHDKDFSLVRRVMQRDQEVDDLEVGTDDEIVKILAKRCPVGGDLRMVISAAKSVTDLERIGDEACRIANLVLRTYDNESSDPNGQLLRDVSTMGRSVRSMLQEALDVYDTDDLERAKILVKTHVDLEDAFQDGLRRLLTYVMEDSRNIGHAISIVLMAKSLERIGEHAQNLAEYVIYRVSGEDIRHQEPPEQMSEAED